MAFTAEQLAPYFAKIEYRRKEIETNISLAFDYLSGRLLQPPAFEYNYYNEAFSVLYDLTQAPGLTPENEALLYSFFNSPNIFERAAYAINRNIFIPFLDSNDHEGFEKALAVMKKLGYSNADLFTLLLHSRSFNEEVILTGTTAGLNFMHAYIAHLSDAEVNDMIKKGGWGDFDARIFYILYKQRREKAYKYAQNFMTINNGYTNIYVMETALKLEFEKFAPVYIELANRQRNEKNIPNAGFHTYLVYNGYAKEKDSKELVNWSEEYFAYFMGKTVEWEYTFSSGIHKFDDSGDSYMPLHGWALYFIMLNNEDRGKELLAQLSASGEVLNREVLKMLKHVMGAGVITYLISAVYQKDRKYYDNERLEYAFKELAAYKGQFEMNALWQFDKYQSKLAEKLAVQFLVDHDAAVMEKAVKAIDDKKKDTRLMAARILLALDAPETIETLKNALDKETDDTTRDLIWQICGREISAPVSEETVVAMVEGAKKRGKLKKPVFTWLNESTLPPLYFTSGRQLTAEETRFVLYRMSRAKGMRTDAEIKPVVQLIDRERSADFAKAVYKAFEEKEFDSKYKFLLLLAALFGNDEMVNKFCSAINKWIENSRKVMCEYGIEALALQGSNKALRWIEWYSRKYRSKKTYIAETAHKALTAAAEELEITIHELGDRIVPDFGFEGLFKHFTISGEEYRAFIDSNFKLAYFNDDNKKLKSVPSGAGVELLTEFKSIAKEVRDVVKAQSGRLEHYLIVQRKWNFEEWQQFFLNNPIMFIYATKLLWGVYDKENKLVSCFICQEDTTLVDKEGNEIEAPEGHFIGIVHPISLSAEDLQVWKRQFFDLSIEPVFPQLERPVYTIADEDREKRIVKTFAGVLSDSGSVKSTLDKYGWRKADTGDGGYIASFVYDDHANKIEAELHVDGVLVYGFDDEATLGELYFADKTIKKVYNSATSNTDKGERLIQLGKLQPVFYSEVVAAIKAIKVREKGN